MPWNKSYMYYIAVLLLITIKKKITQEKDRLSPNKLRKIQLQLRFFGDHSHNHANLVCRTMSAEPRRLLLSMHFVQLVWVGFRKKSVSLIFFPYCTL